MSDVIAWDTSDDNFIQMNPDHSGHYAVGYGLWVNDSGWAPQYMQWLVRPLTTPADYSFLVSPAITPSMNLGQFGDKEDHPSWNNALPNVAVPFIETINRDSWSTLPQGVWDGEIVGVGTDPNNPIVYRFGHHFNIYDGTNFWDDALGNVSQDGRFYMFTSNWNKKLTGTPRDSFIIKLPLATPMSPYATALMNPGFEMGNAFWSGLGQPGRSVDTSVSHSGSNSARINPGNQVLAIAETIRVQPASAYTLGVWVRTSSTSEFVLLQWLLPNGAVASMEILPTASGSTWQYMSGTYWVPKGTVAAQIVLGTNPSSVANAAAWFDDVSFTVTE